MREQQSISVAAVLEEFGVSAVTARRDLDLLAEQGRLRRTHGGAVLPELTVHEDAFVSRFEQDASAKLRIAKAVVKALKPGESLFIDSSSTAYYVLREILDAGLPVTVVTNSLPAMTEVGRRVAPNVDLIGLGGRFRRLTRSYVGAETVRAIRNVFVDRLVFSVTGVESGGDLTDLDPVEAEMKRTMIKQARTVVLVATAAKFDERGLNVIANARDVDTAYLADPPADGVDLLEAHHVAVEIC